MSEPDFFPQSRALTLRQVADIAHASLPDEAAGERALGGVAALETAGPSDLAYMDNPVYVPALRLTRAGACLVSPRYAPKVPETTVALVTPQPYRVFAEVLALLFPTAMRPASAFGAKGISPGSFVHPTARLEHGVTVDPGAVVGPGAEIGTGTIVGAQSVIGADVRIGRDCAIAPNVTVSHAFIGNRVILHPGVRIGQDGFGFALGPRAT